jgi:hypothetical protein
MQAALCGSDDPAVWSRNLQELPIIGVNLALPIIECAGPDSCKAIMMPLPLTVAERCDAVLRIGGASRGADEEVETFVPADSRYFDRSVKFLN